MQQPKIGVFSVGDLYLKGNLIYISWLIKMTEVA